MAAARFRNLTAAPWETLGPSLAEVAGGDREVHSGWVGDGMTRYAHNCSRMAVALLALTAACGSGRPAPASVFPLVVYFAMK